MDAYTAEEDTQFEQFVRFALDLREKFFEATAGGRQEKVFGSGSKSRPRDTSRQRRQTRSGPGFYALPLPYLPQVDNDTKMFSNSF